MNEDKQKGLTASEQFAKKILDTLGWNPKKIHPTKNSNNAGMPDFECTRDRYVEVKAGLPNKQIQVWSELVKDGKQVFIMYVFNNKYSLYKVDFWLEKVSDVNELEKLECKICKDKVNYLYHGDLCEKCKDIGK